jgi:hypothetical protein
VIHPQPAPASKWDALEKLSRVPPVEVLVRDKSRIYFRVTPQAPVVVPVEGPVRLRVVSRIELPAGSQAVATYRLTASEGATTFETLDTESAAASEVKPAAGGSALGKSRRMTFDVPAGSHKVTLALGGASSVLVRIHQSSAKGEVPMVSLTPVSAARSVTVSEGEKLVPYYSVLPAQPVKLRVVGPTSLELLARLDFDATMRGQQTYRLRVSERGRTLREYSFKTTKAIAASYTNLADRVPSKFDRVTLPLGDGAHDLAIELVEPVRGAAEIHARIPEPSVGNEE